MANMVILGAFSTWVLLSPSVSVSLILDLVTLPWSARLILAVVVLFNVVFSLVYEDWLHAYIAEMVKVLWKASGRRQKRDGRVYEAIGH
jgi:cation-transporting P-type ATPase 13A2